MSDQIPIIQEYHFIISETWAVERTFVAEDKEQAYEIAEEYQNNLDLDLSEAKFIESSVMIKEA